MIKFDPVEHKYTNEKGERYISVTQFLHHFIEPFEKDKDFWLYYKTIQYLSDIPTSKIKKYDELLDNRIGKKIFTKREYNRIVQYALGECDKNPETLLNYFGVDERFEIEINSGYVDASWKDKNEKAKEKGTAFHNWKENKQLKEKIFKFKGLDIDVHDGSREFKTLANLEPGVYTELKLWNHEYKLAGTSDQIIILPEKIALIRDFKGLCVSTPIATQDGWKKMGEIEVGDLIFDGEGKLTKVKNVSSIHYNPCYEITFDTNDKIVADHEHRWVINKGIGSLENHEVILTTDEIFDYYEKETKKLRIKVEKIELPDKELFIDPYLLGLWLADGNRTCGTITIANEDIKNALLERGHRLSVNHNRKTIGKAPSYTIYDLSTGLKKYNLIKNKHIPLDFLRGSYKQRLLLLQGFMDGDGYYHPKRKRCVMDTTKKWQADAFMELTSSLGFKPTFFNAKTNGFGKKDIPTFHVVFSPDINPFLYRNQHINFKTNKGLSGRYKRSYRYIKEIKKVTTVPTKCLEVESETHCYLAGKTFIKTHNTNNEITVSNKYQNMKYPVSHLEDCHLSHYNLQLSVYGWMLEQFGYTVKYMEFEHFDLVENGYGWDIIGNKIYQVPYRKKEVVDMLNHYRDYVQVYL